MSKALKQFLLIPVFALLIACQQDSTAELETSTANNLDAETAVVHLVTSGGLSAAYDLMAESMEAELNIRLVAERGASMGVAETSIPNRLARGEIFDVILLSRASLDALTEAGYVVPESRKDIAISGIAMAVQEGHEIPDISSPEKFRELLLAADSIGYSASVSGTYLATRLWPEMGIWESIKDKSHRIVEERVGAVVARGELEIGFQQMSELLPIEGISIVGHIPDELQLISPYAAGRPVSAKNPEDADRVIAYLASDAATQALIDTGLSPIATTDDQ